MGEPEMMRSWRFHRFGRIQNLRLESIEVPRPGPDDCLVKLRYAALNPADIFLVMGRYEGAGDPPFAVGRDGAGTVVIPDKAGRFQVGDQVVALRSDLGITREGTLAEYVAAPADHLALLPEGWTLEQAAAGALVLLTAWQGLVLKAGLRSGRTVVINGASGGVGLAALVLSRALGARAIALSRSAEKRAKLLALGASHVLDTRDEKIVERVRDLGGADVIIENIAGDFLNKSLGMLNQDGAVCVIGALGGVRSEINPLSLIFKRLAVYGIQVGLYEADEARGAWADIVDLLGSDGDRVPTDSVFPFEQVQEAFARLRQGPLGKVVIGPIGDL